MFVLYSLILKFSESRQALQTVYREQLAICGTNTKDSGKAMNELGPSRYLVFAAHLDPTHHSPCNLCSGTRISERVLVLRPVAFGVSQGIIDPRRFFFYVGPNFITSHFWVLIFVPHICLVLVFWARRMFRSISANVIKLFLPVIPFNFLFFTYY